MCRDRLAFIGKDILAIKGNEIRSRRRRLVPPWRRPSRERAPSRSRARTISRTWTRRRPSIGLSSNLDGRWISELLPPRPRGRDITNEMLRDGRRQIVILYARLMLKIWQSVHPPIPATAQAMLMSGSAQTRMRSASFAQLSSHAPFEGLVEQHTGIVNEYAPCGVGRPGSACSPRRVAS
jgi:hypothetical protein